MSELPFLSVQNAKVTFGDLTLFSDLTLFLYRGQRACLVGRNGCGKSTLMKLLAGQIELDAGSRFLQPEFSVGFLTQDYIPSAAETLKDHVMAGSTIPDYEAEAILDQLQLIPKWRMSALSGGERRRADLAQVLVHAPQVLLLDEPTNHLDIGSIEWLEEYLKGYKGALLTISHDRHFLSQVTNHAFWLERQVLRSLKKGYAHFEAWSEEIFLQEEKEQGRLQKKLQQETEWLHKGVTARRKRNQGRLRRLHSLRENKKLHVGPKGQVVIPAPTSESESKLVIEAQQISKAWHSAEKNTIVAKNFSMRIQRGDRLGIIGNNGAGKTTLIKMLLGHLEPDQGTIRRAAQLSVAYSDQKRELLNPNKTLVETLCEHGGDRVTVQGQSRHVVAYLKDFLFAEKQIFNVVSTLSGGEKNRLLLAKMLTQTADLLVLDEPTNDLDMDTLDVLEDILGEYEGTLLLVSHDRDFIDRIVTSTLVVQGNGIIEEFVGGYSDVVKYWRPASMGGTKKSLSKAPPSPSIAASNPKRLSYKYEREQEALLSQLECLRAEILALEIALADPQLYEKDAPKYGDVSQRLTKAREAYATAENRWLDIELMREGEAS